jgi:hypothetical protein
MYESTLRDAGLLRQSMGDKIYVAESTKYPFGAMLKRGPAPKQMLDEWGVQKYPNRAFDGSLEADVTTFEHAEREKIQGYAMLLRTAGWLASKLSQLSESLGVAKKQEKAKQMADDGIVLAAMHEKQMLSDMDTRSGSGVQAYRSRAVFSWLASTAQGVLPVPANFRPNSSSHYTSALASLTPALFKACLQYASVAKKGPVDLIGHVGIELKGQMSGWMERQWGDSNAAKSGITFTLDGKKKEFVSVVDHFVFDEGTVKTILNYNLLCNYADGEESTSSRKSGAFLDMSMWKLGFMRNPGMVELPDLGGGPRGYSDTIATLECGNPLAQPIVLVNS